MSAYPRIAVLYGGVSAEREVSLGSGKAAAAALEKAFPVDRFDVQSESALPAGLDPRRHVVFSTLHGSFGEDGGIQTLMDEAGVCYAGCDAASSALTFDKVAAKRAMRQAGVPVADEIVLEPGEQIDPAAAVARLGLSVVLKPVAQGSSVGLAFARGEAEVAAVLAAREQRWRWLLEPRIEGREATIGIVDGEALEIVEIRPKSGAFDYASKYTKGLTEYIAPAPFDAAFTRRIKELATVAFRSCGCRDYARIDFMVDARGEPFFLEINTLPGLKETSLLPMSAGACGYDFDILLQKLVAPAILRYKSRYSLC